MLPSVHSPSVKKPFSVRRSQFAAEFMIERLKEGFSMSWVVLLAFVQPGCLPVQACLRLISATPFSFLCGAGFERGAGASGWILNEWSRQLKFPKFDIDFFK